ncbi:MAG: DinB family protein [Bryobacteraceae bacterium]
MMIFAPRNRTVASAGYLAYQNVSTGAPDSGWLVLTESFPLPLGEENAKLAFEIPKGEQTDMPLSDQATGELRAAQEFFNRSTRNLTEALSTFAPAEGSMTTAQQVAHVAQTIDWFVEGAFRPEGFDMNFEEHAKAIQAYTSLAAAREWLDKSFAKAIAITSTKSDADLMAPLPEGPVMGGMPRKAIYGAITDHTAHHRGVLTVHARLNSVVPPMPYMDM